jgi:hypothetical protein
MQVTHNDNSTCHGKIQTNAIQAPTIEEMIQYPDRLKALLEEIPSRRPPCGSCSSLNDSSSSGHCEMEWYCSEKCRTDHQAQHDMQCNKMRGLVGCLYRGCFRGRTPDDTALQRLNREKLLCGNYHVIAAKQAAAACSNAMLGIRKRNFHLRKALRYFLERLETKEEAMKHLESLALFLMVLLGGDAQLLLDWFAYTASWNASANEQEQNDDLPVPPPSVQSEENSVHPLLALHGLLDGDARTQEPTHCIFASVYLLACFRSLAEHRQIKKGFEVYKQEYLTSPQLPQKLVIEAVQGHVASFLWGPHGYDYGEALSEEIHRVIRHMRELNNVFGRDFWEMLMSDKNLTCGFPVLRLECRPGIVALPHNLWRLYQESFHQAPELDLAEFIDVDVLDAKAKND